MGQKMSEMTRWSRMGFVALALALGLLVGQRVSDAQGKATAPKVGIVDLGVVFNNYKRKRELEKAIQRFKDECDEKMKKQTTLLKKLDEEAEDLTGEPLAEMTMRIQLELARREIMQKQFERDIREKLVNMTLEVLDEINAAIAKFGQEKGFTAILKVDNQGLAGGRDEFREKIFRAQVQSVLYFDPAVELTAEIQKLLNDA